MINALTIDVEDYFQVSAFEACVSRGCWDNYPSRVEGNTYRILDILDDYGAKATFFVLGWVAERKPALVTDIARRGHEVASHGYGHQRICNLTREEFREDIRRSKAILEDLAAVKVHGYRAPSYSISKNTLWAYDELHDAGYSYDSSVFPIRHDLYGIPDWPRHPFIVLKDQHGEWMPDVLRTSPLTSGCFSLPCDDNCRQILEVPVTTLSIGGKNIPLAGGGYFRLFPYSFTRWGLRRINQDEGRPFVFYLHPWEIDPKQPRMGNASYKSCFRHYLNLHRTEGRLRSLLTDFRFSSIDEVIGYA